MLLPVGLLANPFEDQLYEDLLYYYQKSVRPVANASESLMVEFGSSLIRIIEVVGLSTFVFVNASILFRCLFVSELQGSGMFSGFVHGGSKVLAVTRLQTLRARQKVVVLRVL